MKPSLSKDLLLLRSPGRVAIMERMTTEYDADEDFDRCSFIYSWCLLTIKPNHVFFDETCVWFDSLFGLLIDLDLI